MNPVKAILLNWPISPVEDITPAAGSRTWFIRCAGGKGLVLKRAIVKKGWKEVRLLTALQAAPVPVPRPLETRYGRRMVRDNNGQGWWLHPRLPGCPFQDHYEENAAAQAAALGQAIGQLHQALSSIMLPKDIPEMDLSKQLTAWALPNLRQNHAEIMDAVWPRLQPGLEILSRAAPVEVIHRDTHPSNLLFQQGRLTGILDFELATRGFRSFDLCYCASSLLLDAVGRPEREVQWQAVFQAMIKGYQSRQPLAAIERQHLFEMLLAIELIFLAYWEEQGNPAGVQEIRTLVQWLLDHQQQIPA